MTYATEGVPMDVRSVLKRARETLQLGIAFCGDSYEEYQNWCGHASMVEEQILAALAAPTEALPIEPTHEMLKALAGDPAILAASDEDELRERYKAMLAVSPRRETDSGYTNSVNCGDDSAHGEGSKG